MRRPVFNPCYNGDVALIGATVTLYNAFGNKVAQTVTDSDGYYTFFGLPMGRYSVSIGYPSCDSSEPSFRPSISFKPSSPPTPSTAPSLKDSPAPSTSTFPSFSLTLHPSTSAQQHAFPTGSPSISMPPSLTSPSISTSPSEQPSVVPTKNSTPSPSRSPSTSVVPTKEPSSAPTEPPTSSPVGGMMIRRPAFDPCHDNDLTLVGATVTLYNAFGGFVDQTVTDSEGIYTFTGLPLGRYRTEIDYPSCDRRELSINEQLSPLSLPGDNRVKFYSTGESCDVSFGGLDVTSSGDITYFDTLDECCANVFWYDMGGCFSRSRVAFQFEFCLDIYGLGGHSNCPIQVIENIESAMQKGLGKNSELTLVTFGSTMLTDVGGETKCIGPILDQDTVSNRLRGLADSSGDNLNICGVVVTKEAECKEERCLRKAFDQVVVPFQAYFYNKAFSSVLHSVSRDTLHPLRVVGSSFITRKLLLPSTVTSSKSHEDIAISSKKSDHSTFTETPRFYPTYISGELCNSKTSFDSWEESYGTLRECCEAFFSWDFEACCSSLNTGGC